MNKYLKKVNNCRLCGTLFKTTNLVDFGNIPLANNLRLKSELNKKEFKAPLAATSCPNCGSHQLRYEVSPDVLFKNYNYASPPNLIPHFAEYASTVSNMFRLKENDSIIGIGGNNGLLEYEFIKLGFKNVFNFEPAENIAAISRIQVPHTINSYFNPAAAKKYLRRYEKAKIITSNNCFAHIPDLDNIVNGIKLLLHENGVFIFENAYLLNTLLNKDFGQYYSEHIYYHSVKPLILFFKKHQLRIFDIQLNNVQMGSMRVFVTWDTSTIKTASSVHNLLKLENDFKLYEDITYSNFLLQVAQEKKHLINELKKWKKVVLYGVPAKIVLLINYFGIEKYISYAVDDSPLKTGKYIPGTKIEIKDPAYWKRKKPAATMIGAYNFSDDIIKKNSDYPGKWIIPFK
jgi:hypothetical protein